MDRNKAHAIYGPRHVNTKKLILKKNYSCKTIGIFMFQDFIDYILEGIKSGVTVATINKL
jgi:hypothetical protein